MNVSKKTFWHFFKSYWHISFIALAVAVFFYPIFLGKVPLPGDFVLGLYSPWKDHMWSGYSASVAIKNPILADVVSFTYPMQSLAISLLKNGEWPIWNQYILGGTPLLSNFQSAPFAVTNFVYLFFNFIDGWSARIFLQHFLAALFTYFLLRHWKVGKLASIFGGLFFAFSGFNLIWSQWNAHVLTAAFIPLILMFEDRFLLHVKAKDGAALSICIALQFFSGYPQVVIYTFMAVGLLWLTRLSLSKDYLIKSIKLGMFGFFGLCAASVQLFPSSELLSISQRSIEPHPYEWAFLPISKVITFIAPDYFGNHATYNWWGPQDYTSNTGFIGVIPFVLFLIGLLSKNKNRLFLFLLLVLSILLSFPTFLSIGLWKSGLFGLQAASAHRALVLTNLSISLLAGFGIDSVLSKKTKSFLLPFIPLSIIILFIALSFTSGYIKHQWTAIENLFLPISFVLASFSLLILTFLFYSKKNIFISLMLLVGMFELYLFGWKFTPFIDKNLVFPNTPVLKYLESIDKPYRSTGAHVVPINLRMNYGITTLEGYDAIYPEIISKFLTVLNNKDPNTESLGRYGFVNNETSKLLDIANVSFILTSLSDNKIPKEFDTAKYSVVKTDEPKIVLLENKDALDRSTMFYDWDIKSDEDTLSLLTKSTTLTTKLFLNKDPQIGKSTIAHGKATYLVQKATRFVIEVETDADGILMTSDTYYPGWTAKVDNRDTQILKADYAFRGVVVPKGKHTVEYLYRPNSFYTGLKISIISFLFLSMVIILPLFKKSTSD